jgi:2-(1,2-epoxy-1,2-dihydrophenyl)acetyl-CoA isomerase
MMSDPKMLREDRDGAVAILTMDYPERRNALSMPMRLAMVEALERIESDRTIRAIVLTGAGGVFSSGGDLAGMDSASLTAGRDRFRPTHQLVRLLVKGSKPVIAAIDGWCVGGSVGLALCCDTLIAAEDAKFMLPFGKVGLIPDLGLLHLLPRRVGEGRARQMMLYGETLDAATAEKIGLVDHLVPTGTALTAALERAQRFAKTAPLTTAFTKAYLAEGLDSMLEWERNIQSALFLSADHAEGRNAFLEKRAAKFEGR